MWLFTSKTKVQEQSTITWYLVCMLHMMIIVQKWSTFWTCMYDIIFRHDDDSNRFVCVLISKMQLPETQHLDISLANINTVQYNLLVSSSIYSPFLSMYLRDPGIQGTCPLVGWWYQNRRAVYSQVPFEQRNIEGCRREIFVLFLVGYVLCTLDIGLSYG